MKFKKSIAKTILRSKNLDFTRVLTYTFKNMFARTFDTLTCYYRPYLLVILLPQSSGLVSIMFPLILLEYLKFFLFFFSYFVTHTWIIKHPVTWDIFNAIMHTLNKIRINTEVPLRMYKLNVLLNWFIHLVKSFQRQRRVCRKPTTCSQKCFTPKARLLNISPR